MFLFIYWMTFVLMDIQVLEVFDWNKSHSLATETDLS